MEKVDIYFKAVIGAIGALFSYLIGAVGWAVFILFILMVVDFVSGMVAAALKGEGLSSSVGKKGIAKKVYILILVGLVYLIEIGTGKTGGVIGEGVAWAYAAMELISVIENGGKMGVYIPPQVRGLIAVLKQKGGIDKDAPDYRQDQSN